MENELITDTDLSRLVKPEFWEEFVRFVDTGDASPVFAEYLDRDTDCQKAVELAFNMQSTAFESLFERMREEHESRNPALRLKEAIKTVVDLPPEKRH